MLKRLVYMQPISRVIIKLSNHLDKNRGMLHQCKPSLLSVVFSLIKRSFRLPLLTISWY